MMMLHRMFVLRIATSGSRNLSRLAPSDLGSQLISQATRHEVPPPAIPKLTTPSNRYVMGSSTHPCRYYHYLHQQQHQNSCQDLALNAEPKRQLSCVTFSAKRFSTLSEPKTNERVEKINQDFAEARELIDDAKDAMGTKYFEDDFQDAMDAVDDVLDNWKDLIDSLPENEQRRLIQSMGLKMEQLKAEIQSIKDMLINDHE